MPAAGGSSAVGGGGTAGAGGTGAAGGAGQGGGGADPCDGHCHNASQDCGEAGIDCGGDCAPCEEGLTIRGRWLGLAQGDGSWQVLITTGHLRHSASLFANMTASGKNAFHTNKAGAGTYGKTSASAYQNGHLQQGWDESFWTSLRGQFEESRSLGIAMSVGVWGTVALEGDHSPACWDEQAQEWTCRWDVNPWNAQVGKGGPYNLSGCGKDAFYTFNDYGQVVYQPGDPYPAGADMATRGQWRQEEYIYRLATLCSEFPHVAISLMWEGSDMGSHTWGDCKTTKQKVSDWHLHMKDLIQAISPHTLVATGSGPHFVENFTMLDFLTTEAGAQNTMHQWFASDWDRPVVYTGWTAWDSDGNDCQPDCAPAAYGFVRERIREAWANGVQVGSPFWEYDDGGAEAAALDPYFLELRAFVDSVQSWPDEPGVEVTLATLPAP